MEGYFNKLLVFIFAGVSIVMLMWTVNSGTLVGVKNTVRNEIEVYDEPLNRADEIIVQAERKKVLILSSIGDNVSDKLSKNILRVCNQLKLNGTVMDVSRKDTVSYMGYDIIVIATADINGGFGNDISRVVNYVENGGRLFWAIMPDETGGAFNSVRNALGITDVGGYSHITGLSFKDELIAGSRGLSFEGEEFSDSSIFVRLENTCRIYVESPEEKQPVVWSSDYGKGRIVFYNATSSAGDYMTGMLGGCFAALYDEFMYPVVNAKVVFIDDFPSPQYNSESDIIKNDYNRTVREFYRDIWWPDMQSAAKKFNLSYTGLFMATYNDIVNPDDFEYSMDSMEQYFGNSLLKNDFEIGAHGYNHQSLTLKGGTPAELGYTPWNNQGDMEASLSELKSIAESLFTGLKLQSYVPPSNYLSPEGRAAVAEALPDLKIISGVYTNEASEGDVYVQDFEIADDGIAEFPRFTSGMTDSAYEDFVALNGCGLYGVFSHFIHPDDILDKDRSNGLTWQELLDNFCKKVNLINERFEGLRPLTASPAADALKISYSIDVKTAVLDDKIIGSCYNFYGEASFFLKSDKKASAASDGCTVTPLTGLYDTDYYLVKVSRPSFVIKLED